MPTFILTINWTDQGIRAVRDAPKRSQAARELAKKVGVEIKDIFPLIRNIADFGSIHTFLN